MKFTKSHDGTITCTMSPDEASMLTSALGVAVNKGFSTSTVHDRTAEISALLERASTCKPTDVIARVHSLFNELGANLITTQDNELHPQLFFNHADEIQDIAMKVDALHHDFTNEIQSASR